MRLGFTAALVASVASPAFGHRLDEYLQNTILSVEKHRFEAEMTLTPGVSVFPLLIASIDTDGNGVISAAEQRAYAERVLHDISLRIDGFRLSPQLVSIRFPAMDEMRDGRGRIQLDFSANLPRGGRNRSVSFANHHQSRISAYQVNCLVSRDPGIRIRAQKRNYSQSEYELEYLDADVRPGPLRFRSWQAGGGMLGAFVLILLTRLVFAQRHGRTSDRSVRTSSNFHSRS